MTLSVFGPVWINHVFSGSQVTVSVYVTTREGQFCFLNSSYGFNVTILKGHNNNQTQATKKNPSC